MQSLKHLHSPLPIFLTLSLLFNFSVTSKAQTTPPLPNNIYQVSIQDFQAMEDFSTFFNDQLQNYPSDYQVHEFTYAYVTHGVDPLCITINSTEIKKHLLALQQRARSGNQLVIYNIKLKHKQTNRIAKLDRTRHLITIQFT